MLKLAAALAISVAAAAYPYQAELQRFEAVEPHMGTLVRITVYCATVDEAREAFRGGFDRIRELDNILSDYKPQSELSRITARAVGRPVRVSDDLFRVLEAAQRLAEETGGAFDVTEGPVVRLWREARTTGHAPNDDALADAGARSGFKKLHLDARARTVMVDLAGMALDVGGIGKGYAASEALAAIAKRGIRSALVAVSGDLAFSNAPPGQSGWRIQIHSEDEATLGVPSTVELTNRSVSTSGSSEQHLDVNGQRYSHVIDPTSRMGLLSDITVTVVAPHGLEADGLDTAASVLGVQRGLALIESHRDAGGLIVERTHGSTAALASTRFRKLLDFKH
jgi:FAD:protein FMN transferase